MKVLNVVVPVEVLVTVTGIVEVYVLSVDVPVTVLVLVTG